MCVHHSSLPHSHRVFGMPQELWIPVHTKRGSSVRFKMSTREVCHESWVLWISLNARIPYSCFILIGLPLTKLKNCFPFKSTCLKSRKKAMAFSGTERQGIFLNSYYVSILVNHLCCNRAMDRFCVFWVFSCLLNWRKRVLVECAHIKTTWVSFVQCFHSLGENEIHMHVCVYVCASRSVMSDSAIPWTVVPQAPLFIEFSKQEYWSGLPFPSPTYTCTSYKIQIV